MPGRQPGAVRSALSVLRLVASSGPGLTAAEIAAEIGLPRATAYRVLNLLVGEEYLVRTLDLGGFALGARYAELLPPGVTLPAPADPLPRLRSALGVSVQLVRYAPGGIEVVRRDPCRSEAHDRVATQHLHASAMGRVLLAHRPSARDALADGPWPALTAATLTHPDRLDDVLRRVRADGHALQLGEVRPDLGCLAVPVMGPAGLLGGVVACGAAERVDTDRTRLATGLHAAATDLVPLLA